jgi:hypothetical protein
MSRRRRLRPARSWLRVALPFGVLLVLRGGGGLAAFEADTADSYGAALMWALSLMTTVGFVGGLPHTVVGRLIAAALIVSGFALLTLTTAAVSSLFVRDDEAAADERDRAFETNVIDALQSIQARIDSVERNTTAQPGIVLTRKARRVAAPARSLSLPEA